MAKRSTQEATAAVISVRRWDIRVRQSIRGDWLAGLAETRYEERTDEIVMVGEVVAYALASKDYAIAEGLRQVDSGG